MAFQKTDLVPQNHSWLAFIRTLWKYRQLYWMLLPGLVTLLIFAYGPMPGLVVAFKDYSLSKGIIASPWVGFAHFERLFTSSDFYLLLRNTLSISLLYLIFTFPAPILLALLLHEVTSTFLQRFFQSAFFLPHFFSWTVVVSLTYMMLSSESGLINKLIMTYGGTKTPFMLNPDYFYTILVSQALWKDIGYNSIVYFAAIAAISPHLYEAARVDGANKSQEIRHITLPGILPTIVIIFIWSMTTILTVNFEQIQPMLNPLVMSVGDVIDTYAVRNGIQGAGNFSYATAIGLFQSVIGFAMVLAANWSIKRFTDEEGFF